MLEKSWFRACVIANVVALAVLAMLMPTTHAAKLTPGAKTFYPEGYYKRVGYQKSEVASSNARVDALGQRVRDRFNEDFSEVQGEQQKQGSVGLHHRNLKQLKQSHSKGGPNSYASSRPASDIFSKY